MSFVCRVIRGFLDSTVGFFLDSTVVSQSLMGFVLDFDVVSSIQQCFLRLHNGFREATLVSQIPQ